MILYATQLVLLALDLWLLIVCLVREPIPTRVLITNVMTSLVDQENMLPKMDLAVSNVLLVILHVKSVQVLVQLTVPNALITSVSIDSLVLAKLNAETVALISP